MTTRLIATGLALVFSAAVIANQERITCAIDDSGAYFTGKTTTDKSTGKTLWQYKCNLNSHLFWIVK